MGGLVFGWVSDHFGRIPALMGSNLVSFVFGTLTAFSTSFWQFTICRFFVGMGFDNCFTLIYILGEIVIVFGNDIEVLVMLSIGRK